MYFLNRLRDVDQSSQDNNRSAIIGLVDLLKTQPFPIVFFDSIMSTFEMYNFVMEPNNKTQSNPYALLWISTIKLIKFTMLCYGSLQ